MNIETVLDKIDKLFPDAKIELKYSNPFQLLSAVLLSAQATDVSVNKATDVLFEKVKSPKDILDMGEDTLREYISSIGLYNSKSKNLYNTSKILVEEYNSQIPNDLEKLVSLPGVGEKTAKIVLNVVYGGEYIPVDTHIHRISNRLGRVKTKTPAQTMKKLEEIMPAGLKHQAHYKLVYFGRYHCKAKKPLCEDCLLKSECKFYQENN